MRFNHESRTQLLQLEDGTLLLTWICKSTMGMIMPVTRTAWNGEARFAPIMNCLFSMHFGAPDYFRLAS